MRGGIDISLLGDKLLAKKFARFTDKMQNQIFKKAAKAAAVPVVLSAKSNAPVKTGAMRDSIKAKVFTKRGLIGALVLTGNRETLGIDEEDKYYYPAIVEYKTKPFLRPALDSNEGRVRQILMQELRKAVSRP
jgi:HK97 gp10 family phage protein